MISQTPIRLSFFLFFFIYLSLNTNARQPRTPLSQQYNDVVVKAGSYQGFKEIKEEKLKGLWKNMNDSLKRERQLLNEANAKLISNGQTVIASKVELENIKSELEQSKASVNQVSFLGILVEKWTYNLIMWGLVLVLAAALASAVYRSNSAVKEARYRTGLFNDLTEEFQKHKVAANDKEKKLARELQTERNRIAELTQR